MGALQCLPGPQGRPTGNRDSSSPTSSEKPDPATSALSAPLRQCLQLCSGGYRGWSSPPAAGAQTAPAYSTAPLRPFPNRHRPQEGRGKACGLRGSIFQREQYLRRCWEANVLYFWGSGSFMMRELWWALPRNSPHLGRIDFLILYLIYVFNSPPLPHSKRMTSAFMPQPGYHMSWQWRWDSVHEKVRFFKNPIFYWLLILYQWLCEKCFTGMNSFNPLV